MPADLDKPWWRDVLRHVRFLGALGVGLVAIALTPFWPLTDRLLIGADLFFASFLAAAALLMRRESPAVLRRSAQDQDEGIAVIILLALGAIGTSVFAIISTITDPHPGLWLRPWLALASVPLGWAMLHTVMALHYASIWYGRGEGDEPARGLDFQQAGLQPGIWDFLYYSFTIGMTAQTADVTVNSTRLRRVTLIHSVLAFFYNTVLVALAVSAAGALAG
ncbi:MAG: DUF1345 domain-containing protein [Paracoccus sp. (in: a-proteobacteria)]|uniref:DUF1345 domain-containing protein n=1 Tax=Paracoccus sp. TaxID=267 RepID=UPI0026E0ED93|nr:DUF1345 domain-containing protein [Paracoccus sp. (in: a-proteobacteria)]MDO5622336.1 DUF1345 domain-containing protein [Paracoccus sp. (in: a-proteobacteria)]